MIIRRAQKEKAKNEARLQETVTLLSQGLNPYEHFRRRDIFYYYYITIFLFFDSSLIWKLKNKRN